MLTFQANTSKHHSVVSLKHPIRPNKENLFDTVQLYYRFDNDLQHMEDTLVDT